MTTSFITSKHLIEAADESFSSNKNLYAPLHQKRNFQADCWYLPKELLQIHIWVSLIIGLIMLVIQRKAKRKWAFSNMMSVIRYHLMTYIDLFKFLEKPDGHWSDLNNVNQNQLSLFET